MSLYTPINGWTKRAIKDHISREFKGKATDYRGHCQYLTAEGKKCVVGCFIPEGHPAQRSPAAADFLSKDFPEMPSLLPLEAKAMGLFQEIHDDLNDELSLIQQLNLLLEWVDTYVADPLPSADVGAI